MQHPTYLVHAPRRIEEGGELIATMKKILGTNKSIKAQDCDRWCTFDIRAHLDRRETWIDEATSVWTVQELIFKKAQGMTLTAIDCSTP